MITLMEEFNTDNFNKRIWEVQTVNIFITLKNTSFNKIHYKNSLFILIQQVNINNRLLMTFELSIRKLV